MGKLQPPLKSVCYLAPFEQLTLTIGRLNAKKTNNAPLGEKERQLLLRDCKGRVPTISIGIFRERRTELSSTGISILSKQSMRSRERGRVAQCKQGKGSDPGIILGLWSAIRRGQPWSESGLVFDCGDHPSRCGWVPNGWVNVLDGPGGVTR